MNSGEPARERPYQLHSASLESYKYLQQGGKIGEKQVQVFNLFVNFGPMSAKMMHEKYCQIYGKVPVDSVNPRIRELKDMAMLVSIGKDKCKVTGNLVEFTRPAEPGEDITIPKSTKRETKKILEANLWLIRLWRNGGPGEKKVEVLKDIEELLKHFYPDEIAGLRR